ncbi:hypothetical protein FHETE_1165 [Fusarium heterosporum]|uniref:Ubiquitin-like protease family profile domain-containing protein n=1 Tax=Fusarium heterosporum TaxID=42747 RepID=A0A8H5U027_FUSHE|nr:hypothetical protein FHETE_1165 [Fusarium heterosporum]
MARSPSTEKDGSETTPAPPVLNSDRRLSRPSNPLGSPAHPSISALGDQGGQSITVTPLPKSEEMLIDKHTKRINWLDQKWGGNDWMPQDVRKAQTSKIGSATIQHLVKLTRLAQRENIPLASLWDETSPHGHLRRAVNKGASPPRLTYEMTYQVYRDWNESTGKLGASGDISDADSRSNTKRNLTKKNKGTVRYLGDSNESDNDDIKDESMVDLTPRPCASLKTRIKLPTFKQTPLQQNLAALDSCHTSFDRSHSGLESSQAVGSSVSSPKFTGLPPLYGGLQGQGNLSTKRRRDEEPIEGRATKRPHPFQSLPLEDHVSDKASALVEQLTEDVRLKCDSLDILTKVLVACYPLDECRVHIMDPLWFKVGNKNPPERTRKFDDCNMVCFPIHHASPKHWSLAVVHLTSKEMTLYHHDSTASEDYFTDVCKRFREWKEHHGFGHFLSFSRVEGCAHQLDTVNCGIHVLSCLRHVLTRKKCPDTVSPIEERNHLIDLMRKIEHHDKHNDFSETDRGIIKQFNKFMDARKKQTEVENYTRILAEVGPLPIESLVAESKEAESQRDMALENLQQAEKVSLGFATQHDILSNVLKGVDRDIDAEAASLPTADEPRGLITFGKSSPRDLINDRTKTYEREMVSTFREGMDFTRDFLQQQVQNAEKGLRDAQDNVSLKKSELKKAEDLFNYTSSKVKIKQSLVDMVQQHQQRELSNN